MFINFYIPPSIFKAELFFCALVKTRSMNFNFMSVSTGTMLILECIEKLKTATTMFPFRLMYCCIGVSGTAARSVFEGSAILIQPSSFLL